MLYFVNTSRATKYNILSWFILSWFIKSTGQIKIYFLNNKNVLFLSLVNSSQIRIFVTSGYNKKNRSRKRSVFAVARQEGLEPATFWFVAKHSIQLSYWRRNNCPTIITQCILKIKDFQVSRRSFPKAS